MTDTVYEARRGRTVGQFCAQGQRVVRWSMTLAPWQPRPGDLDPLLRRLLAAGFTVGLGR